MAFDKGRRAFFPSSAMTLVPRSDDWWTLVFPINDGSASTQTTYGNVGRPVPQLDSTIIEFIDLELDVVMKSGRFVVVDQDDFSRQLPHYSAFVASKALETANDLASWLATRGVAAAATAGHYYHEQQCGGFCRPILKELAMIREPGPGDLALGALLSDAGVDSLARAAILPAIAAQSEERVTGTYNSAEAEAIVWRAERVADLADGLCDLLSSTRRSRRP